VPTLAEKFLNDTSAHANKNLKSQVRGLQTQAGQNDTYRYKPGPYKARVLKFEHLDSTQAPVHVGTTQGQTSWGQININNTDAGNVAYYRVTYRLEDEATGPFDYGLPAPASADDQAAIDLHAHAGSVLICNSTETAVLNYWDLIRINFDPATRTNAVLVQPPAPAGTVTAQALVPGAAATASGAFAGGETGVGTSTGGGPTRLSKVKDMSNAFIANGHEVKTDTNNIININSMWEKRLVLPETHYRKWKRTGKKLFEETGRRHRPVDKIIIHWDGGFSARSCYQVFLRRKVSSHFVIDNRGEIYQFVDTQHITWHAGGKGNNKPVWGGWVNKGAIGIDISMHPHVKFNKKYEKWHGSERPMLSDVTKHGKKVRWGGADGQMLGMYPVQYQSLVALCKALCDNFGIAKDFPRGKGGEFTTHLETEKGFKNFRGIICHYHIRADKPDIAGLDLEKLVKDIGG